MHGICRWKVGHAKLCLGTAKWYNQRVLDSTFRTGDQQLSFSAAVLFATAPWTSPAYGSLRCCWRMRLHAYGWSKPLSVTADARSSLRGRQLTAKMWWTVPRTSKSRVSVGSSSSSSWRSACLQFVGADFCLLQTLYVQQMMCTPRAKVVVCNHRWSKAATVVQFPQPPPTQRSPSNGR
jgi:hypothetical protein